MREKTGKTIIYVSTGILAAVFLYYVFTTDDSLFGMLAAALSCFLFALCLIDFIQGMMVQLFQADKPLPDLALGSRSLRRERRHPWLRIALFIIITRILLYLAGYAIYTASFGYQGGLWETLQSAWLRTDSPSYLGIAQNWYVTEGDPRFHIVFFPMYPVLIRIISYITGGNYFAAAMTVSMLCSIGAAIFAFEFAALDMERKAALRFVKYLFILPAAFFFAAPMTESLFLLLTLACAYFVRKKHFFWGCVMAALAAFTRSVGVLMLAFIAVEYVADLLQAWRNDDKKNFKKQLITRLLCMLVVPLGLLGYLYINYSVTGDAFTFMTYQREHWSQGFGLFFESTSYQLEYMLEAIASGNMRLVLGLYLPNLIYSFASLGVIALAGRKRMRASHLAYFLVYFVIAIGVTWLLSAPRYLTACFPVAYAVASLTEKRNADTVVTLLCLIGLLLYLALYVTGYPVY